MIKIWPMCQTIEHEHEWIIYLNDAEGFYSKREVPGKEFHCRGQVMKCANQPCDTFLFVPHHPNLHAVEAMAT